MTTTVRSGGIRGFQATVRSLGADPAPLLRRHRISARALLDEETLISLRSVVQLLEDTAHTLRCPDFGLRMSRYYDVSVFGPLSVALQHCSTVKEALLVASRYLFIHTPAMVLRVLPDQSDDPGTTTVYIDLEKPGAPVVRQSIDATIAAWFLVVKALAQDHFDLREVWIPHEPVASLSVYRRYFGAPVRTSASHGALVLSNRTFHTPLRGVSKTLQRLAFDYLKTHYKDPERGVVSRVEDAVRHSLGVTPVSRSRIAALMAVHPRTLQRHLEAEGTSFDAIADDLRKERALHHIRSTQVPLKQVADLIGLSHPSALVRCCRRWFGKSPLELRKGAGGEKMSASRSGRSR